MSGFLRNLAFLAFLGAAIYFLYPDLTPQVISIYQGL